MIMKKILYGKKYDTETAREICSHSNGLIYNDINYLSYTLYLKKTGEFFLLREGYNKNGIVLSNEIGDMGIFDLDDRKIESVEDFVAAFSDVETYEELFGEVAE